MGFRLRNGRHQSAESVRGERDFLASLLDSLDVAVVSWAQDGRLTYVNPRAREVVGVDCGIGSSAETWIENCRLRSPSGAAFQAHDLPLMKALDGQLVRGVDVLATGRKGDVLLTGSARPLVDEAGIESGAVVVFKDVTTQRAHDTAIRRELGNTGLAIDALDTIASGRLLLYAQPIVDIETGETVVEELLLRVRSSDGTISGPADFLAAAERYGTITAVDRWVFDQAAQIASGGRHVTVNVSATTVSTPAFLEEVEDTLARYGLDPALITLEITETAVVSDVEQVSRFAERLDQIGCHFALDDFGTGYAALTYLKHLPVRYLKIDIDFIQDLSQNPRSQGVVNGVVALAAQLGHETIAEGVEDLGTFELLGDLGVNLAQGFGVGEPTPVSSG